ncbi:MAG: hypothetical protein DMG07_07240, partial [Acidobacteria bacterium]
MILRALSVLVALAALMSPASVTVASNPAAERFRNPPDAARMTTYWIWPGPAVGKEGVERDLQNMRAAGIGGGVLLPIYPISLDDPARGIRSLRYLSPEFLDVVRYTAKRSRELGMTFDLTVGTGWPFGGPSVTPEYAAHKIVMTETPVKEEIARVQLPELKPGEEIVALFLRTNKGMIELPSALKADGTMTLPPGSAGGTLVTFLSTPTGQMVKRSALGAEGLVLDHLNSAALRRYLAEVGEKLWAAVKDVGIRSFWCDSLEVYGSNWTPGFLKDFRQRRGYDLRPLLPLLFGPATPESNDVRHDFWRTVSELAEQEFVQPLQQWTHAKGTLLQMEPYGQPPVSLSSLRYVDLPVGEHYEWRMFNSGRWTSSGAWLFGRRIIGVEAYTWSGIPNRFGDSLEQLKYVTDMHFLSGVNALMAVSYIHNPRNARLTEWTPYWGPVFNEQQTWWPYFHLLSRYVQRVSDVLQQGDPVADIGLLLPADDALATAEIGSFPIEGTTGIQFERAPTGKTSYIGMNLFFAVRDKLHHRRAPEMGLGNAVAGSTPMIETMITNGYSFGGVDSFTLPDMRIEGGRLNAGSAHYKVLVLPNLVGLRLETMEKIAEFCRRGGIVIATLRLPEYAYGWKNREENTARLKSLVAQMFGERSAAQEVAENSFGSGKAIFVADETTNFAKALQRALPGDILFQPVDPWVTFMHRHTPEHDFYFVCNMSGEWKSVRATFRVGHRQPQLWDPLTGETRAAVEYRWQSEGTGVPLALEPYGSLIVTFSGSTAPPLVRESNLADLHRVSSASVAGKAEKPGTYFVVTGRGRAEKRVENLPPPLPM